MIWLLTAMLSLAQASLLRKIGSCGKVPKDARSIMLVKEWNLAPSTITKGFKERYPQERNQSAIYIALADRIKSKRLDLMVAAGCEGEINSDFETRFNGWDYSSLKAQAQTKAFQRVLSHVPMKLKARYPERLTVVCGDSESLIQEGQLRLTTLRGWHGFWSRLNESSMSADKTKLYAEAAAELLKVSKETPVAELLPMVRDKLKADLELLQKSISDRNDLLVKALQSHPDKKAAIVIGGVHIDDLRAKLEAAGIGCELFEPSGYQRDEENLLKDFQKAAKN